MSLRASIVLFFLMFVTSVASAGKGTKDGPGTKAVRGANDTISALLTKDVVAGSQEEKDLAAKVTASVRGFLDVDALGKRALVDHWDGLTEKQRTQFLDLLRGLIEDNYVKGLRANVEYKVKYKSEAKQTDGTRLVKTEIKTTRHGHPYTIKVDYVLEQNGKSWKAFDVITDKVSLVENYRTQFNKIIAKDGFDGLIAKMQKKRSS
jgi:phospholipid transport system substrate-binding protein